MEDAEESMKEWGKELANCSGDEIKYGLETWDAEFPPNVYQFRTRCKAGTRTGSHKLYEKPAPVVVNREAAAVATEAMRDMVTARDTRIAKRAKELAHGADREWFAARGWKVLDNPDDYMLINKPIK
jgi:hypothetical protein